MVIIRTSRPRTERSSPPWLIVGRAVLCLRLLYKLSECNRQAEDPKIEIKIIIIIIIIIIIVPGLK